MFDSNIGSGRFAVPAADSFAVSLDFVSCVQRHCFHCDFCFDDFPAFFRQCVLTGNRTGNRPNCLEFVLGCFEHPRPTC